jgi:hypothetical protein
MNELVNKAELEKAGLSPTELLKKFREQLTKDFEMSNALQYLKTFDSGSYENIHENIRQALDVLNQKAHSGYQQLLYRVDLSEKQVNTAINAEPARSMLDVMADLVIKRILQKVILKAIHSKK